MRNLGVKNNSKRDKRGSKRGILVIGKKYIYIYLYYYAFRCKILYVRPLV